MNATPWSPTPANSSGDQKTAHTATTSPATHPAKPSSSSPPDPPLVGFFAAAQNLQLDHTDPVAVAAFVEETNRLYGLEFFPHIPLDA